MYGKAAWIQSLTTILTVSLLAGCGFQDEPDDSQLQVQRTLIVEDGRAPRFLNSEETHFLFVYPPVSGPVGIYLASMGGEVVGVHEGSHNHDYIASPNGEYVAFSTPSLQGGVVVVTVVDGTTINLLEGGHDPAWIDNNHLVATSSAGSLVKLHRVDGPVETLIQTGSHAAVSADGQYLAYLVNSSDPELELRYTRLTEPFVRKLADRIGLDAVWDPVRNVIYASQLVSSIGADVVRVTPGDTGATVSTLLSRAYRPSVSADGSTLFANRDGGGGIGTLFYMNLQSGQTHTIADATNAAAGNGRKAVVEQADGIYLITF